MPELELDPTCTPKSDDENSDSDDEQFEDVYSPAPADKEDDWGVTAIIKQPMETDDEAAEWAATATIPLRIISAAQSLDRTGVPDMADAKLNEASNAVAVYDSSDDVRHYHALPLCTLSDTSMCGWTTALALDRKSRCAFAHRLAETQGQRFALKRMATVSFLHSLQVKLPGIRPRRVAQEERVPVSSSVLR